MSTHSLVRANPIRKRRLQRGWTQAELAQLASLSPSRVCLLERGLVPNAADLIKLSRVLGCPVDELEPPSVSA